MCGYGFGVNHMNVKMKDKTRNQVTSGLFWTFGERITAQLISTIVGIVLARVLDPEHYGIIAIVTVFITFFNVFVTSGFSSAIVQKKDTDELDYNTAFYIGLAVSIIAYIILFIASDQIAVFYKMPDLSIVIKVMSLRLPMAALNATQQAYVSRKMEFKKFFIATSFGTMISGIVGVAMALYGFGVWALVAQYLTNTSIDTVVMWFVCGWRPKLQFSRERAVSIYSFGWKVLVSDLVGTIEGDIRSLIIGKQFGSSDLAYFDSGKKYPALLVNNINAAINKVMLPVYSRNQDNIENLKNILRKSVQLGLFILAPIMLGLALVADDFVIVVLTEKWIYTVPYIQIFCVYYLTRPLETSAQQAILAIGRSDIILRIMIAINCISIGTLLMAAFLFHSVLLIAVGSLLTTLISLVCYLYYSNKLIGYHINEQFADILPSFVSIIVMGIGVKMVSFIRVGASAKLIIQIVVGMILYVLASMTLQREIMQYVVNQIKSILFKK